MAEQEQRQKGYEGTHCPDCGDVFSVKVCCKAEARRLRIAGLTKLFGGDVERATRAADAKASS